MNVYSSSETPEKFLPTLQPFQTCITQTQPKDRTNHSFTKNQHVFSPDMRSVSYLHPEKSSGHGIKNFEYVQGPNIRRIGHEEDNAEKDVVVHKPGPLDKKRDRKSQARRYLVEGLHTTQYGSNGRRLCRSNTFSNVQGTSLNLTRQQGRNMKRDESPTERNLKMCNRIQNIQVGDTSLKVKKAIENWNELVLELNSDQRRHYSYEDSVSIESDSSFNQDVPSPLYKHKHHKSLYAPRSILPHTQSVDLQQIAGNSTKKSSLFSAGLSFARYRPITPNLLLEMDKKKLSSRKKTQRWVNQLEFQGRSYNNSTTRTTQEAIESSPAAPGECLSPNGASTTPVERRLHRTESYGSSRTRQSGIPFHTRKQPDFL